MKKKFSFLIFMAFSFFLQGCASIIYLKSLEPEIKIGKIQNLSCLGEVKIVWVAESFGMVSNQTYEKNRDSLIQKQKDLLREQIDRTFKKCEGHKKTLIEVKNIPVDQKRLLALLNIISFGIIPYFDEYSNSVEIKYFDQDGNFKNQVSSVYRYEMIHSIFLWPAMPFYINGTNELNIKTIPMHFNNISEEIHKSAELN